MARRELERRGSPYLLYRDDAGRQHLIDLASAPERLSIGRHPGTDVAVPWDVEVSRLHAEVERIAGEWTLVDDGRSRNGTFLNGDRVTGRRLLADGDEVRVGRTLIVFRAADNSRAPATTMPDARERPQLSLAQRRVLIALCRPYAQATSFASPASNKQICDELCVSNDTVKGHLRALFEIFGMGAMPQNEKRATLAREAIDRGVVTRRELDAPG